MYLAVDSLILINKTITEETTHKMLNHLDMKMVLWI